MPLFTFDMTLSATITVDAPDEATAREWINEAIECADTNFGAWPDGSPILGECSLTANMPVDLVSLSDDQHEPEYLRQPPDSEYSAHIPHRIKLRGFGRGYSTPTASMLTRAAFQEDDGEID